MTIEQILKRVETNNPKADLDMIRLAYEFANNAHKGQFRKTGEEYIQHSLHTAFMLAQMRADEKTVIAGLLHDVPEDTSITLKEIEKNFGKEISSLVKGITKLGKIKYRGIKRYRENLKKMFLSMAVDIRVIIIKFCDRLHNLKTLDALPENKQERIAKETMEIYAPIAQLLGIWNLKWQMEDISFKYLNPNEYKKVEYKYAVEERSERNQYIQRVKKILAETLKKEKINFKIEGRFKHLYSIWQKMKQKNRTFNEIYDVFALRVTTNTIQDCYKVLGMIHSLWKPLPGRFKDYIAMPKPNGYRSLHTTIFGPEKKSVEFQIRTEQMDEEAKYGISAHWYYKYKNKNSYLEQPNWVKEILEKQRKNEKTTDFLNNVRFDVFRHRIFAFSPKGDVFELPEKATPIDFAYSVHTDIGNKAMSAKVNQKIAPLDQELKNGDMVEIIIEKNKKHPSPGWLKFVKTSRAKEKIKQHKKENPLFSIFNKKD